MQGAFHGGHAAALRTRRCLIPADGFYEWQKAPRQPFHLRLHEGELLALAGLWETWRGAEENVESFTIITTDANDVVKPLHDRMPVILAPEHWQVWLSASAEEVAWFLTPYQAEAMWAWPVDRRVSRAGEDDAGMIEPLD